MKNKQNNYSKNKNCGNKNCSNKANDQTGENNQNHSYNHGGNND